MLLLGLKLKVIWVENFLGLAIDQTGTKSKLPLTGYYFWPKTEAWEQVKLELAFKNWIKEEEKIRILNLITEVMNFWRLNRNKKTFEEVSEKFCDVQFLKVNK